MESTPAATLDISDSLGLLRHRWWMIILATLLGVGATGLWLQVQEPVWESTTSVLVHPAGRDINVAGGRTQGQVNLDTEAQLVRSTAVAVAAAQRLEVSVAPDELARRVGVQVPANTSVLMITFAAGTPAAAQAGARAFAEAYLDNREEDARADLAAQMNVIETKLDELNTALAEINEELAVTPIGSPTEANLESRQGTVTSQLNTMTGRLNELATATVAAGVIISEARLPTEPSRPLPALVLGSGAMLGLVLGLGAAAAAERLVRRVRRPADISRRAGLPVLAVLTASMLPQDEEILTPYAAGGRTFDRLRNEVLATLTGTGKVIVVTSASRGSTASLVAANLAASLSRAGHDVILVGARLPENIAATGPLTRLLGIAAAPGLSEVLAGRAPVAEALQRTPRHPRMQAMSVGGTATATGLLQSPALRGVLATLVRQAEYVVVEAPPTTASADAQSLASHADTALLVVEPRRARLLDVVDAAEQLRRVGTPVLGAVVVPPLRRDPEAGRRAGKPADTRVRKPAPDTRAGDAAPNSWTEQSTLEGWEQSALEGWAEHPALESWGEQPAPDRAETQPRPPAGAGPAARLLGRRAAKVRPHPAGPPGQRTADPEEPTVAIPRLDGEMLQVLDAGDRRPAPRAEPLPAKDGKHGRDPGNRRSEPDQLGSGGQG